MVVFPILYTAYISLTNMNVYHWFDFTIIGLENYIRALFVFDSCFLSALFATILWTAVNMVLQLVIAFVLVSLLNIQKLKLRKLYKTLLMFPWAMPGYVSILLWKTGIMNNRIPYDSIIACKMGNEEALQEILKHYVPMIIESSKKKQVDSNGVATYVVDGDVKAYIISELTMAIMMKYDPTRIPRERKH